MLSSVQKQNGGHSIGMRIGNSRRPHVSLPSNSFTHLTNCQISLGIAKHIWRKARAECTDSCGNVSGRFAVRFYAVLMKDAEVFFVPLSQQEILDSQSSPASVSLLPMQNSPVPMDFQGHAVLAVRADLVFLPNDDGCPAKSLGHRL